MLHALRCSTPSPFHPSCSFLWTLQLCCSPFRRHEYLQLCMFESLLWARDSHHRSAVCVCAGKRAHGCVRECIHLCACVCLVLCKVILIICSATTANTLHMNNRVRSVIPPRRLLHWQAGGSSSISVWKQLRVSTQPAGGLHSSSGELAVSSFLTPRLCCLYLVLLSFFKFFLNVYMWFGNQPYMWDPV